jgi:hypothetical protein
MAAMLAERDGARRGGQHGLARHAATLERERDAARRDAATARVRAGELRAACCVWAVDVCSGLRDVCVYVCVLRGPLLLQQHGAAAARVRMACQRAQPTRSRHPQAELAGVRALELPELEARHREAAAKAASEAAALKHALKQAEAAAAAAHAAAAASSTGDAALLAQLQAALRAQERCGRVRP